MTKRGLSSSASTDPLHFSYSDAKKEPVRIKHWEAAVITNPPQSNPRIFYGWLVVAAAFAVTFVGFGSAYTVPILASVCANVIAAGIMAVTSKGGTLGPPGRGR